MIGIAFEQIPIDAVKAGLCDLCPSRVIQKDSGAVQGWELLTNGSQIK